MNNNIRKAIAVDLNLAIAHLMTARNRYKSKISKGRVLIQAAIDSTRQADQMMPAVPNTFTYKEDVLLMTLRKEGKPANEIARKMKKSIHAVFERFKFLDELPEDMTANDLKVLHDRGQAGT